MEATDKSKYHVAVVKQFWVVEMMFRGVPIGTKIEFDNKEIAQAYVAGANDIIKAVIDSGMKMKPDCLRLREEVRVADELPMTEVK